MSQPTRPLDEAVREHYRAQSLDTDSLASLRDQIHAAAPEATPPAASGETHSRRAPDRGPGAASRARPRRLWRGVALGAITVAFVGVVALAWPASGAMSTEAVAREIAMQHIKALEPDVRGESFEDVAERLRKLEFAPVHPGDIGMEEIVGGRYCSLGGEMAAQIRFVDAKARVCTLYQVRDTDAFRNVEEGTYDTAGLRVHVWRQGGLVMGLAEPMPEA